MNLPNALTILRIFFVPLLVAALVQQPNGGVNASGLTRSQDWLGLAIFLLARPPTRSTATWRAAGSR